MSPLLSDDKTGEELVKHSTATPYDGSPRKKSDSVTGADQENNLSDSTKQDSGSGQTGGAKDKVSGAAFNTAASSFAGGQVAKMALKVSGFTKNNSKGMGIGGGVIGIIMLIIFGIAAFLPLKLESLMKNIYKDAFKGVNHAVERRSERIFLKYAIENSTLASSDSGKYVATGNPLGDLYKTWRTNNFEKDLADKYGLKIERSGDPSKPIRINSPQGTKDFASAEDFSKWLDTDLSKKETRAFIKSAVKSETKWYQILRRRHLRKWLANSNYVKKWSVFKKTKGDAAKTEVNSEIKTAATDGFKSRIGDALACTLGSADKCEKRKRGQGKEKPPDGDPAKGTTPLGEDPPMPTQTSEAIDGITGAVSDAASADYAQQLSSAGSDLGSAIGDNVLKNLAAKKLAGKAIPVVGWIDLAARLDNVIWNGSAQKAVIMLRKAQYIPLYADMTVMNDQLKDGKTLSGDESNALMKRFQDSENSNASQTMYNGNPDGGVKVDPKNLFGQGWLDTMTNGYQKSVIGPVIHLIGQAWLGSLGKIMDALGWLVDKIGGAYNAVLTIVPGISKIQEWEMTVVKDIIMWVFQPVLTGDELGPELTNALDVGGHASGQDFAQSLGGEKLTEMAYLEEMKAIAADENTSAKQQGLWYNVASLDNPSSLANRIIINTPSSPGQAITNGVNTAIASLSSSGMNIARVAMGIFSGQNLNLAYASNSAGFAEDKYGLEQYGFSEAALAMPLAYPVEDIAGPPDDEGNPTEKDDVIDENDCPTGIDEDKLNLCLLDMAAIQSLKSMFTTEDDGGIGEGDSFGGALGNSGEYLDPLRDVKGYSDGRVDAGIDYGGNSGSPIYAIGNAKIIKVEPDSLWGYSGGGVNYKLLDGPAKDLNVFVGENCKPPSDITKGKIVNNTTVICKFVPGTAGIETGWATKDAAVQGMAHIQSGCYGGVGANANIWGVNFQNFLKKMGFKRIGDKPTGLQQGAGCKLLPAYHQWKN